MSAPQGCPTPTTDDAIVISGTVKNSGPLTVAELQALRNDIIDVISTAGGESQNHTFVGTSLLGVLDHVGIDVPEGAKNPLLSHYIVVAAKDSYQVIISGGELDLAFGNTEMYLAWEQDGAALARDDGPIRLVVPGDTKGGRYISGIVSIEVIVVGEAAATPVS